ncbi:hypothetical protein [uncultured Selenomonas sp.]|uniref:hypothetical protein n=1 Tax=uncultured Selenomonas sp. TaxID=159275 RepID=UPI0003AD767C|nr:hypothetical protein [Selenomonas sp. oral taxon 892]ERJ95504.1 hypothetical protein HMPREF1992_00751 [Selenomonas sp. oral taxon 892 str. F0426]
MGSELGWWIHLLVVILIVEEIGRRVLFAYLGTEKIVPKTEEMTAYSVVERTDERLVIGATIPFANEGKQCATIMDAILRVQLPYEQYDGALVRGKVELAGAPREDDYFEAVLIQKRECIDLVLKLSIEGRKGNNLEEAIAHMPDFRMDLIYQETGRIPAHYSKIMLKITAAEIAALAGVALVEEGGRKNG